MYMFWHGVTERMVESMCLFHSMVKFPYYETPQSRYKQCRPTSYYSQQEKEKIRDNEIVNYAVSKAAHAILDIRMAKLCRELLYTKSIDNNSALQSLPVDACCSKFAFDIEGRIQNYTPTIII